MLKIIWFIIYLFLFKISFIFTEIATGKTCRNDNDCSIPNSYCLEEKICSCKPGFIEFAISKVTFSCLDRAINLGDACMYDIQCTSAFGTLATCKGTSISPINLGKCECSYTAHYQDGICYKSSRIGEECQVNDNCVISTPNLVAYCDQSRCICPPYYHANHNGTDCLPSSNLGGPCLTDEDCITINSKCSGVCTCKVGFVQNADGNRCLLAANKLYSPCDEDRQCTQFIPRTTCDRTNKRCACNRDSHEVTGACYKSVGLHEPCHQKKECLIQSNNITRVDCYSGFCICSVGFEMINRTDCVDTNSVTSGSSNLRYIFSILLLSYFIILVCQSL